METSALALEARVEADQGSVIEQAFAEAVRRDPDQQRMFPIQFLRNVLVTIG